MDRLLVPAPLERGRTARSAAAVEAWLVAPISWKSSRLCAGRRLGALGRSGEQLEPPAPEHRARRQPRAAEVVDDVVGFGVKCARLVDATLHRVQHRLVAKQSSRRARAVAEPSAQGAAALDPFGSGHWAEHRDASQ